MSQEFLDSTHGQMGCVTCHDGVEPAADRAEAHNGMIALPSKAPDANCQQCHSEEFTKFQNSLHYTSAGVASPEFGVVVERANPDKMDLLTQGLNNHCASCHTQQCGDCHVSRPQFSDGGLSNGHVFKAEPHPVNNCTACHGSRIQKEMMAQGPADYEYKLQMDVHWAPGGMKCTVCHTFDEFHDNQEPYSYRYDVAEAPRCEDCHVDDSFYELDFHTTHADSENSSTLLQCQVCHSQAYNNCYGCHVGQDDKEIYYFKTDESVFDFKIGKNPLQSEVRPYDFVLLRHVPVAEDTFAFYGEDILSNYDSQPTWKYATPHNIRRVTPQSESCNSCHGNENIFLQDDDLRPEDREANQGVITDSIPASLR